MLWRVYLQFDTLRLGEWIKGLNSQRERYESFREEFTGDTRAPDDTEVVAAKKTTFVDPLSDHWSQKETTEEDADVLEEIRKDVTRTFPDVDFFQQAHIQDLMTRILFIYAKLNPNLKYRQGMHELLGPIIYVLTMDSEMHTEIEPDRTNSQKSREMQALNTICDSSFIEHDSFSLFEVFMKPASRWYAVNDTGDSSPSQIVTKSRLIQQKVLKPADPVLARRLEEFGIEPQIWGLRWIRLLFSREFSFPHVLQLWDAIFAASPKLDIVDYVCAVLLLRIRDKLLECNDDTDMLTTLFQYPTFEDEKMWSFVSNAVYLKNHIDPDGGKYISDQYSHLWKEPTETKVEPQLASNRLDGIIGALSRNVQTQSQLWGVDKIYEEVKRAASDVNTKGFRASTKSRVDDMLEKYLREQRAEVMSRNLQVAEELKKVAQVFEDAFSVETPEYKKALLQLRQLTVKLGAQDVDTEPYEHEKANEKPRTDTATESGTQTSLGPDSLTQTPESSSRDGETQPTPSPSKQPNTARPSNSLATPTRKSLAQSQFSWMLGDESPLGKVDNDSSGTDFGPIAGAGSPIKAVSVKKAKKKNVFEMEERGDEEEKMAADIENPLGPLG